MVRAPLMMVALLVALVPGAACASGEAAAVPGDRWVEMDLYWFDARDPEGAARRFWDRYAPLYQGVQGYKGVVLNVNMSVGFIMAYTGDAAQAVALPKGGGQELGVKIAGQLQGDTAARQAAWAARFAGADNASARVGYGPWRYGDLARLTRALREEGRRRGVDDFRVGAFATAFDNVYGEPVAFAVAHREAWTRWRAGAPGDLDTGAYFDPASSFHRDPHPLAAFPNGLAEGTPVWRAFAAQWGALSRDVGFDALMLRDGFGLPRTEVREGPFGSSVPDAATARRMTDAVSVLLRGLKAANPHALTMMWSSAATATSDWRANGLDLERIAREGDLDIFVDQTWAGAWGEVGVRQHTFWNAPILGWTFQLATMLEHAAVLSGTKVRHYPLVETFDAWESWDTIHTAPERLRWGIWAYSHAGVKTPSGLEMPAGSYISWGNQGRDLLSERDVAFLANTLDDAARDSARVTDILGPTLVYSRAAMARQVETTSGALDLRDQTDEQVGAVIKWPAPVLSATRAEWAPRVKSDLFLFGATTGVASTVIDEIVAMARSGQPMAFLGAPGAATDPAFARLAGVASTPFDPPRVDLSMRATVGDGLPASVRDAPRAFDTAPTLALDRATPGTTVYTVGGSSALVLDDKGRLDVSLWDPPTLSPDWNRPLRELMDGDPAPWVLEAAVLTDQLARRESLRAAVIDPRQTGTVAAWKTSDGAVSVLVGNLEEGLRDDSDRSRTISLAPPPGLAAETVRFGEAAISREPGRLTIRLLPEGSALVVFLPSSENLGLGRTAKTVAPPLRLLTE